VPDLLSLRALNRATLARQMLLERRKLPVAQAIERLAGLQAQAPNPPYVGLWSRLEGFRREQLTASMQKRRVVRMSTMRSTLHLMTARDALAWRPLLEPVHQRGLLGNHTRALDGIDRAAVVAAGRALLDERPRTGAELGQALAARWKGREADLAGRAHPQQRAAGAPATRGQLELAPERAAAAHRALAGRIRRRCCRGHAGRPAAALPRRLRPRHAGRCGRLVGPDGLEGRGRAPAAAVARVRRRARARSCSICRGHRVPTPIRPRRRAWWPNGTTCCSPISTAAA
jgi:hypothetical protein